MTRPVEVVEIPSDVMEEFGQIVERLLDPRPFPVWARERELQLGNMLVEPGAVTWLRKNDWVLDDLILSITPADEVRIVLVRARKPFTGAFRRLVEGIVASHLTPVVVAPLPLLAGILTRWGWERIDVGSTFADREDQWRIK